MTWRLQSIDLFVRELPPQRMSFTIGKSIGSGNQAAPIANRRPNGYLVARVVLADEQGNRATGVSGDRASFGWLDKRDRFTPEQKLERLLSLVKFARETWLASEAFDSPFTAWRGCYQKIQREARERDHEELTASFACALFERAVIDAVCRMRGVSINEAVRTNLLGVDPGALFPRLRGIEIPSILPASPRQRIAIRHTVGGADPLTASDLKERVDDGEPETLEDYIRRDGVRFFKVKIGGNPEEDLERLAGVWEVVQKAHEPAITLDGNESYEDLDAFAGLVSSMESRIPGLFQHLLFIEQPLPRALTHDASTSAAIHAIGKKKALLIDEADGSPASFPNAFEIGYAGTSHKNCKGFMKSLINLAWCHHFETTTGREAFLTGEDLSNMPIVPLQQDFAAVALLGIAHCERNGHHYTRGLPYLSTMEKTQLRKHHPDLYVERDGEMFLNIRDGEVHCASLQTPGFGVGFLPDWESLTPLDRWQP